MIAPSLATLAVAAVEEEVVDVEDAVVEEEEVVDVEEDAAATR